MKHTIEDMYYVNDGSTIFKVFHGFVMNEIKFNACRKMGCHNRALSDDLDRKEMQEHVY